MPKILIADDERDQEELFRQRIMGKEFVKEYEFVFCRNGKEAWQAIQTDLSIELVLLDINMPEIDGLTLLSKIKEFNPAIQAVMISAYGDMPNIRVAMNNGAFDFVNKPIQINDLRQTISKTLSWISQLKEKKRIEQENEKLKNESAELEMQALRAQMNPHFIFNALNSITRLIQLNEKDQAEEYILKFSKLIRNILENSASPLISLQQELNTLKLYVDLESLRIKHNFSFTIEKKSEVDDLVFKVPPLILQPFVENAIHHGILPSEIEGKILVQIEYKNEILEICIEDNGIGRKKARLLKQSEQGNHRSMGMVMSQQRIKLFAKIAKQITPIQIIDLENEVGNSLGTRIVINLPAIL